MELSIFLAKVIGLYLIILSVFILIRHKAVENMLIDLVDNKSIMFVIALITLILGILLIVSHNIWVMDWRVIITIIGWLIFISGIIRLFFFASAKPIIRWWLQHRTLLLVICCIYLLLGLFLLYKSM